MSILFSCTAPCLQTREKISFDQLVEISGGALSTCTYGEISLIFLSQNIAKSDIFGTK